MEDDQPVLLFDQILKIVQAMSSRKEAAIKQADEDDMLDFTQQVKMLEPEQQGTSCELTKEKFAHLICKIISDGAEFPEDLFNIQGCILCGSKGHDIFDCLGYITWISRVIILDEQNLTSEERSEEQKAVLDQARQFYNPRPQEIYVEIDDGEYLTNKGVKIIVKSGKIVNLIPRHLHTTTTSYPDLPTPEEMNGMLKLSSNTPPNSTVNCYG